MELFFTCFDMLQACSPGSCFGRKIGIEQRSARYADPYIQESGTTKVVGARVRFSSRLAPTSGGPLSGESGAEGCEVIIHGLLKDGVKLNESITDRAAYALLSTVLPSLEKNEIVNTRVLRLRRLDRDQGDEAKMTNSGARHGVLPSLVARLARSGLVIDVMRAKSALANNYLTTNDIKPDLLAPEAAACMTGHTIFINEMLPREKFQLFKSLRPIAQGLGFKYVWHAGSRFLARKKGGERAHVFASAADLQAIQTACQATSTRSTSANSKTLLNSSKSGEGADQANEPAGLGKPEIPEYLFCSVQQGSSPPILAGVVYRLPKIPMQKDSNLFSTLRDLASEYSHKIIMGDLNADLLSTSDEANTINRLSEELALQIIPH
ncbi:hypothetical protein TSAR_005458 [Trichomalopsis sarcophagae]|uniref:FP protein C-terminal domain-containing protein n=1 Tax=Trichomalopsis sarcophagae TaxID=543379 RepID=A0A232ER94_9HYME|nr:hypothetical protein TSAR_005458 [Trichomalopsis sarcophagae]